MTFFSFSTVLMTVLISSLMLAVIALCLCNDNVLMRIGYRLLTVFCIVILIRLVLPLELPFTQTLLLPEGVSCIIAAFRHSYPIFYGVKLSPWAVFCVIWLVGAVVLGIRFMQDHKVIKYYTREYGEDVTHEEPYASILEELCSEEQLRNIRILRTRGVDRPMIAGLLRPVILLPENDDASDDDTLYAIKHEIYHYIHHDLWIKSAVKCLTIAYWWNPFIHLLNRQVDTLLEMRIDGAITKRGPEEALGYVISLLHFLTGAGQRQQEAEASLDFGRKSSLHRRIHMIQCQDEKKSYVAGIGMLLLIVSMYIGSYLVIFEAHSYGPEITARCIVPSRENIYVIENEDGTYDVYRTTGRFLDTVDSLEYFQKDIIVYSSKEEYHEKNQ